MTGEVKTKHLGAKLNETHLFEVEWQSRGSLRG